LKPDDYSALMQGAKLVSLKYRKRLHQQDTPVDAIYFPLTSMIALLASSGGKPGIAVATIGNEGVVGASEIIYGQGSMGLTIIQIPGTAVRIEADAFRKALSNRPAVKALLHQHMYALMRQILYGPYCNQMHCMAERCARWLLMTSDRAGQDTFPPRQDFLSHMLGVRRATVNVATGKLKRAGFIRYVRGKITVTDRPGLESASCNCYQAIVKPYDSVLPKVVQRRSLFAS
jgi:CRP-like cAMP-binding protein